MNNKNLLVTMTTIDFQTLLERMLDRKLSSMHVEKEKQPRDVALISRLDVAKLFGVSKTTIDKWRRARILPPIIKMSSRIFFDRQQIMEVVKRRQRTPDEFSL